MSTESEKTKVTLIKDGLTHAGKPVKSGDVIEVDAVEKAFLAKREFIAGSATAVAKPAKSTTAEG